MAEKERSCFLKPGMELEARFCAMDSCQRLLAFRAAAAWNKLTFIEIDRLATDVPLCKDAELVMVLLGRRPKEVNAAMSNHSRERTFFRACNATSFRSAGGRIHV